MGEENEEENEKIEENKEENRRNSINEIKIIDKKIERASIAKLDEIIQLIFFSIQKSNEKREVEIIESIQEKIQELKISNILEEVDNLDIIKNIKTLVIYLLENFITNLDNNNKSDHQYYHNDESQNLLLDQNNEESRIPLYDIDDENMEFNNQQKIIDPFNFILVQISRCENCNNFRNIDIDSGFYQLNLSETCNNLDECFKSKFQKKCDK